MTPTWTSDCGRAVLYLGDCLEVLPGLPKVGAVVTSPPYDSLRRYAPLNFDGVSKALVAAIEDGGVIVWVVADQTINGSESLTSFKQAIGFCELGMNLHDTMIFHKQNPPPLTHNRYEQQFEYMFVFSKGKPAIFNGLRQPSKHAGRVMTGTKRHDLHNSERVHNYGQPVKETKLRGNVWSYPVGVEFVNGHPAVFPAQLASDHVESWTNEDDTVLDCFCGSGTTGVACMRTGRKFIGIEINEQYFEIAKNRIEAELRQPALI